MYDKEKGLFITIDANIGAGKTNMCHAVASAATSRGRQTRVLEEPTFKPRFQHFLSHYYDDLKTGNNTGGGFEMQMYMLCERYEQHRQAVEQAWGENGIVVIQDRPIYGDTVFATTAMEQGFMTKEEYELYVSIFRNMSRDIMPPDVFVYMHVDPEECYRRMCERSRSLESEVPLDYLIHLDKNYQKLVKEMRRRGVKVLVVDWNEYGPPVTVWKEILKITGSEESWFEQLTFSFNKHPRMPIVPKEEN